MLAVLIMLCLISASAMADLKLGDRASIETAANLCRFAQSPILRLNAFPNSN